MATKHCWWENLCCSSAIKTTSELSSYYRKLASRQMLKRYRTMANNTSTVAAAVVEVSSSTLRQTNHPTSKTRTSVTSGLAQFVTTLSQVILVGVNLKSNKNTFTVNSYVTQGINRSASWASVVFVTGLQRMRVELTHRKCPWSKWTQKAEPSTTTNWWVPDN